MPLAVSPLRSGQQCVDRSVYVRASASSGILGTGNEVRAWFQRLALWLLTQYWVVI